MITELPGMAPRYPHVAAGMQYARDIVSGVIPACKWVKLACHRHLDDLENHQTCYFDPKEAEKWCKFIELMPHTKGKWAAKRETIRLEPWQCFKTMCIFGWKRKKDGLRRFRRVFILEPRKNAKSTWAAAVGVGMLCIDGEFGAEVYSGATSEKQAWEVFRPAHVMVKRTAPLREHYGINVNASNLNRSVDGSRFEPLIGNPGDGSSPSCAIVDEYHEHDNDRMVDTMLTGMGARDQPLLLVITTAGDNMAGPCYAAQKELEKVLDGVLHDDELFGLVYTIDAGDDWTDPDTLRKANPNMGVSVGEDYLIQQQKQAVNNPRKAGIFRTKHLNVWVQARDAYFNVQRWQECETKVRIEEFYNQPVRVGMDLASKHDITALELLFRLDQCECPAATRLRGMGYRYVRFGKYHLPSETTQQPENQPYQGWVNDGWITETDGNAVDYVAIRDDIFWIRDKFQLVEVAFDPHQARMMVAELMEEGIECIEVRPLVLNFSEPMKEVDALIRERAIAHDGDPVYSWMLSNVLAKADQKDNVYPVKDKAQPQNKIDGPVAHIMVMARWMLIEEKPSIDDFLNKPVMVA